MIRTAGVTSKHASEVATTGTKIAAIGKASSNVSGESPCPRCKMHYHACMGLAPLRLMSAKRNPTLNVRGGYDLEEEL